MNVFAKYFILHVILVVAGGSVVPESILGLSKEVVLNLLEFQVLELMYFDVCTIDTKLRPIGEKGEKGVLTHTTGDIDADALNHNLQDFGVLGVLPGPIGEKGEKGVLTHTTGDIDADALKHNLQDFGVLPGPIGEKGEKGVLTHTTGDIDAKIDRYRTGLEVMRDDIERLRTMVKSFVSIFIMRMLPPHFKNDLRAQ
ncbi:uncharacterized protein LOC130625053 [Hydractinia symbiolongicarpus]|uniref:uncharacterized protein LOC130625053 n=1 Tax=Hydractinia symbiolongicarpus TaxID=13093 RepID=UPI00254F87FF|nr:uncharacterized protein LOC130625053 [Hydractinia symbiolongicarpus]